MPMWGWGLIAVLALLSAALAVVAGKLSAGQARERSRADELASSAARLPDALQRIATMELAAARSSDDLRAAGSREAALSARLDEATTARAGSDEQVALLRDQLAAAQQELEAARISVGTSNAAAAAAREQADRLRTSLQETDGALTQVREELRLRDVALAKAEAERDAAVQAYEQSRAFIEDAQAKLKTAFVEVAGSVFDERAANLDRRMKETSDATKESLATTLKPFAEQVGNFQSRIEQLAADQTRDSATLTGTIGELKTLNQQMADATGSLAKALKGNAKTRGDWGEMILETVLKASGLEDGVTYHRQTTARDDESNQRLRPDVVIDMPDGRQVVVDSKVNLIAWSDAHNADTPEAYNEALISHATALRTHMRDLSDKNYPRALGSQALDLTILFVPIEGALSAALTVLPDLQAEAFGKRVVFASPNTLMAMLKVIERLWARDRMQKQVEIIGTEAGKMLDALSGFIVEFNTLGEQIDRTGTLFRATKNRLTDSSQSVVARARRLVEAGAKGKRALPDELEPVAGAVLALALEGPVEAANQQ